MVHFVLFEHAAGYATFKIIANEEIGALLPEVQQAVGDLERFGNIIKLVAFSPFKSGANALENINSISEGVVHEDLKVFLETNIPTGKKKSKICLGVSDGRLGAAIQESISIQCDSGGAILEILRGIRMHFHKIIPGLTAESSGKAQLGLGHSYSRAKVKFNVHRSDNMIIQTIALLDQLDKDVNTFSMRIREWYSYHFPELVKIVNDNYMYARVASYLQSRKDFTEDKLEGLTEILMDEGKAQLIYDASKSSMGMDISVLDLINIKSFANRVVALADYRKKLHAYLISKMDSVAPNLSAVIGEIVGARLIAHAGSLTNLAKYPASTVQILGAEKALFRALKTRGKTPKYGLIFHSSFIGKAAAKNKGRISRYLANKCSMASRIDCFTETPSNLFGKRLHEQIEDRLKFYETGEAPKKNIDVMREVLLELTQAESQAKTPKDSAKKKKKKKKRKSEAADDDGNETINESLVEGVQQVTEGDDSAVKKKKKKKRKADDTIDETVDDHPDPQDLTTPMKKQRKEVENSTAVNGDSLVIETETPKKKKKKKDKIKPEE